MSKTKIFILTFILTWIASAVVFDHYRSDDCYFLQSADLPEVDEPVILSV